MNRAWFDGAIIKRIAVAAFSACTSLKGVTIPTALAKSRIMRFTTAPT
jgi:hypothetical protein